MSRKMVVIAGAFVLLSSCSQIRGLIAEPSPTDVPTATETQLPTETPTPTATFTPEPTFTPTATPEPVQEIPLWYFEESYSQVLEVEPDADLITAPCQTHDEEICVIEVKWCPEGEECTRAVTGFNYTNYFEEGNVPDFNMFGPEIFLILTDVPWNTGSLFFGEEEYEGYFCLQRWDEDSPGRLAKERWPKFFFPITEKIFEHLFRNHGYRSVVFGRFVDVQACIGE